MQARIYQGRESPPVKADITVVIDVIRAFTVSHYAFMKGIRRIFLVESVKQAFQVKKQHPEYLLAGEVDALKIEGFDLDNSPYYIQQKDLEGKVLVQKTTNGVRATLNNLSSEHVFVTGFTNARKTAEFIRERIFRCNGATINIIASHPCGDDDLACAKYVKSILEDSASISEEEVISRIQQSHVAEKFFDKDKKDFKREDIYCCTQELNTDFVMKVNKTGRIPVIERVNAC
ncbi:2-phosphosulfolactate phosphatase [Oceanobacillus salinisoli]|uniref:2-phosphosulfolactate phosphatase n=1 Tax=Oceanobacillus salinisoli TaxID=2678611 RepID=UPI0012E23CED|nr:2-phosphosulfolactate phosphatase [Oceanobacillus salinisoli]